MVAAYLFRSAKTGANASREFSSCEGFGSFSVHVHDEVSIGGKERHLPVLIATIGAIRVGLDEVPDGEAVRGLIGGDRNMLAHDWSPCSNLPEGRGIGSSSRLQNVALSPYNSRR